MSQLRMYVLFCGAKLSTFTIALLPMVGFQIRKMQMYVGEFLTKVACSSVLPDTVKCICQMYFKYAQFNGTGLQCRVVSHVGLGGSGLAGQKLGKFVEGWTRDTQHSEGRTLGGHWTLCPAGTPNGERCQPETLDTVFQGSQKAAKEALVFSPSYMRVSHIVNDKSINEVREIFAGNRMLELFLSGAIIRGRKIGEMGWVVK